MMITAPSALLYLLLLPLLTLLLLLRRRDGDGRRHGERPPPSPPGALPVLGHLHLMGARPHVSLRGLAEANGLAGGDGLMLVRLGQVPNLVVSSPRAAEAVLRERDHALASRPPSAVSAVLHAGACDVAMAPYGEYWRQARRLVTTHLLGARKVHSFRRAREEEVRLVLAGVSAAAGGAAVDVSELLGAYASDVVCRAVSGKSFREDGRNGLFRELAEGNAAALGGFNLEEYFPSLARVGVLTRLVCARTRRLKKRWDNLLDEIVDEHAARSSVHRDHGQSDDGERQEEDRDFIDVLLSLQAEYGLTRDQVKGIVMDMFAAGTDTSFIVMEYAMVELIRNPHIMAKLQDEIINNTPKGQDIVMEDNLNGMTYLKAVIKETLRLHPPVPLLLPRISMEKCEVNGYTIPAGMRVIVNAWALGRDPRSWEKAEEFMPERFMDNGSTTNVDFKGKDFKFLPFGGGRRICPGISFGMATVEIMLANLLYCFDWELPAWMTKEDVHMIDVFGLTMHREGRLFLVPRSRMVNDAE
ncbi:hypothetical protein ACP4OV_018466 [Aristida adscensionis]